MTAVRPPEFAPRLAVAALLLAADRVVLADTFAFSRQSGHNRTRINSAQGPQWLTVPRTHGGVGVPLVGVGVVGDAWRRKHRMALQASYGRAAFYEHVAPEWAEVLETPGSLADLAVASVRFAARWLRVGAEIVRASELPGAPGTLPAIVAAVGARALLSLPDAAAHDAQTAGVPVHTLRFREPEHRQPHDGVTPGLGILDLLMSHGPAAADVLRAGIEGPATG